MVTGKELSYGPSNTKYGLRNQGNVLQVPKIGGLEKVHIGNTVLDASLLESGELAREII